MHAAQKSNRKAVHCTLGIFMYSAFPLVTEAAPPAPLTVCESVSWSEGEVLRMGSVLPGCKSHPADRILLASRGQ